MIWQNSNLHLQCAPVGGRRLRSVEELRSIGVLLAGARFKPELPSTSLPAPRYSKSDKSEAARRNKWNRESSSREMWEGRELLGTIFVRWRRKHCLDDSILPLLPFSWKCLELIGNFCLAVSSIHELLQRIIFCWMLMVEWRLIFPENMRGNLKITFQLAQQIVSRIISVNYFLCIHSHGMSGLEIFWVVLTLNNWM